MRCPRRTRRTTRCATAGARICGGARPGLTMAHVDKATKVRPPDLALGAPAKIRPQPVDMHA